MMKKTFALIFVAVLLIACASDVAPNSAAQIDKYLTQLTEEQTFSGAVLVARDGEVLINKGYGTADFDNQIPNTPQTQFHVHWVTMQFTAMAVLMLESVGKLDVQDPICQYIPDCPEYWQGITIHHLLTHTAGLSDTIQWWDSAADRPANTLQFIERIWGNPPYFPPGEQFRYSGNGYIVLGHIIEQVSGQPYETFVQQRVFEPLGMTDSGFDDSQAAVGYKTIGAAAPVPSQLFQNPASGLLTSVEDLYRWDQALYGDQLLPQDYLDRMFTGYARTPSMDIEEADYGYGWFNGRILDRPVIAHGGMMSGFTAMFLRFPDECVTIIVLRNYELQIYDRLEIDLAKMVFGEE